MSGFKRRRQPYHSSSYQKRPRPASDSEDFATPAPEAPTKQASASLVIVTGLPHQCSVLELKSRFEMYGTISRLHIDQELGFGYITFRSKSFAEAAVAAAADPSSPITVSSNKVHVTWPNDPVPQWTAGVQISSKINHQPSSKLLRPEIPLSKHGRGSKRFLGTTDTMPRKTTNKTDEPYKGREIVAYDDLL